MNMTAKQKRVSRLRTFFQRSRSEHGVAAVEMAIILPILMAILFGIINFGTVFYNYISLTNAAREGARWGSVRLDANEENETICKDITAVTGTKNPCIVANQQAKGMLISYGGSNTVKSTATLTESEEGSEIYVLTVTVHSDFSGLSFFKSFFKNGLTATARMYLEPAE